MEDGSQAAAAETPAVAATQVGEADLLAAIPAVEVVHRCGPQEEAAAAGLRAEEVALQEAVEDHPEEAGHLVAVEADLPAEEDGLREVVEDHLVEADGHHLEVDRREAAEDPQEAVVACRRAEEAEDPRGAARVDLLLPLPHQGAPPAPGA